MDDLQQISNPVPNQELLNTLYPTDSTTSKLKTFAQDSAAQNGTTTGGINSESALSTGATASQNGVNPAWVQSDSSGSSSGSSSGVSSTNNSLQSPTVGSTSASTNATAGQITAQNQSLISPQKGDSSLGVQTPSQQQSGLLTQLLGSGSNSSVTNALGVTTPGESIQSAINNFGGTLGFGSAGGSSEAISPALSAADPTLAETGNAVSSGADAVGSLTSTSLSSVLGAGGLGALGGGVLANLLGENSTGGSIGGGLGAAAGSVLAGTSAVGASAIGATLGSALPIVGTIAGGVIGAIVGGLFGGGTPTSAIYNQANYSATGAETNESLAGEKNPGGYANFGTSVLGNLGVLTTAASSALGIQFNPDSLVDAGISTQHGGASIDVESNDGQLSNSGQMFFNYQDPTSTGTAYYNSLVDLAGQAGYTNTTALYNWFYGVGQTDSGQSNASSPINIAPQGSTFSGTLKA